MGKLKDLISNFLKKKGYELKKIRESRVLLTNVFNTDFKSKVLISYLTTPFTSEINFSHTNLTECYTAAEIFRDLGYNVDVIDLNESLKLNFADYKVIYGMGNMFEESFESNEQDSFRKIYYGTGNSPFFYYREAGRKLNQFYEEKHTLLPESCRLLGKRSFLSHTNADTVICLGNSFCKKTYTDDVPYLPTHNLNAFYFDILQDKKIVKDVKQARKHFLWFGSAGLISKGLSDCIDYFKERPELTLHICGASRYEKRFWEIYDPIIEESSNIINHGFVQLKSEKFIEIISQCMFAVFPSISEGGSPALLNLMANGALIPIATEACSVDVDQFGFVLEDSSKASIGKVLDQLESISDDELLKISTNTQKDVRENYTFDIYKKNLSSIIQSSLNS